MIEHTCGGEDNRSGAERTATCPRCTALHAAMAPGRSLAQAVAHLDTLEAR